MSEGPLVLYVYQFLICGIESALYQNSFFHIASWLFFFVQKKIKSVSYI